MRRHEIGVASIKWVDLDGDAILQGFARLVFAALHIRNVTGADGSISDIDPTAHGPGNQG